MKLPRLRVQQEGDLDREVREKHKREKDKQQAFKNKESQGKGHGARISGCMVQGKKEERPNQLKMRTQMNDSSCKK